MRHKIIFLWLFLFSLLCTFLQLTNEYHFFFIEQFQLFQFSGQYITGKLIPPGGLSLVAGEFLTQFFISPYAGAVIVSFLLTITGVLSRAILQRIAPQTEYFGLYLLPVLALLLIQFNFNYFLQGTVAFILFLVCFYLYVSIPTFTYRLVYSLIITPLLFWWGGAISCLFIMSLFVWELLKRTPKGYLSLIVVAEFLLLVFICIQRSWVASYSFALLPDMYFHPLLSPPTLIYYSWISIPTILWGASVLKKYPIIGKKKRIVGVILQALFIFFLGWKTIPQYNDTQSAKLKELDYYARTEQWNQIIEASEGPQSNYLYLCYLNMALMEKRELGNRFFHFDQKGAQGLLCDWNKQFAPSNLLSEIYFSFGEIALSQRMAFESYLSVPGEGNPRNLKRLIQTNLIFGEYPVAEKYISILEKTYGYKEWAKEQRKFLYNDTAIEADPLLGTKRQLLPTTSTLTQLEGFIPDLLLRASNNPSDNIAVELTGVVLLLGKELNGFKQLVEQYYGTPALSSLPVSFQEAVILMAEQDTAYWKQMNISQPVIDRYNGYKRIVLQNRSNPRALPELLKKSFGNTYWYYYSYK